MLRSIQQRDLDRNRWIKISMGVILVLICVSMVVTLVPGLMSGPTGDQSPDAVATIAGQTISINDFQQQFDQVTRNQSVPQMMRGIYANQLLNDMVFRDALEYEAGIMGIQVTSQDEAERIRELIPSAWSGNTWLKDRYIAAVQQQTGMSVDQFESALHDQMVMDKFREMVTAGVTVSPAEIQQEFRWRNEKVKIDYALIKPSDLASTIHPTDAELSAWFAKNLGKYQIPEKRSAHYALLDLTKLRASTQVSDDELKAYYNSNIDQFKVENRVHVEDILFKTVGKTDAEVAEIRKTAEGVLMQAKKGANFEDLAKKYSDDDASKAKGGDLGWIVQGQTVPEFEKVAFGLPKGQISDLVQTQYGFQIIKVLDHEQAHTKTFDEVRASILQPVMDQKVTDEANNISDQMAAAVRQSDRQSLDDLAKKFNLEVGETQPSSVTEAVGQLGNTPDLHQVLFSLHPGELSQPLPIDNGYVILTVTKIVPGHQGTLAEVHDQALADYQKEKSIDLARARVDQLSKLVQGGQSFDQAAKSLGLMVKTSDSFARNGSIPDVGTGRQVDAAFDMMVGQVGAPVQIDSNWLLYRVVSHDAPNPDDLAQQKDAIQQQLLQTKQSAAFEAFHNALVDQLKSEGKLTINADLMKRFTSPS